MVNVELLDDFEALARDSAGGLDRAAQPCLFARLSWFRLLQDHCPPGGKPLLARASDGDRKAWLFLAAEGRTASAYAAWYSLRVGAIGDAALVPAIAARLRTEGIATLTLSPVEEPEPLATALRSDGWRVETQAATGSWVAHTAGLSFDDYWVARPGQLRSTAKRKAKAAALEIEIHRDFNAQAWDAYEAIYRASWKPEEGSFPFLRALAEQEGAAGTLRLGIARKDGRPIAAQYWTIENGTAIIHKLAYTEDSKALSPGTILGMAMFRAAIDEDRVALIDYGTGDDSYKRDWMDERRQLWRIVAHNPGSLHGLAAIVRRRVARLVGRGASG